MRLRYDKKADVVIQEHPELVITAPNQNFGNWHEVSHGLPIRLEIGMGKGQFIVTSARKAPNHFFIGMEKEKTVLKKAIDKMTTKLENVIFVLGDAKLLAEMFGEDEVDHIYLNFSDPWPKKRHTKRRLTDEVSLDSYRRILKCDGLIEFKTDNRALFEYSLQTFVRAGWTIEALSLNLHEDETEIITTEYEDRFVTEGHIIYYVKVKNGKNEVVRNPR